MSNDKKDIILYILDVKRLTNNPLIIMLIQSRPFFLASGHLRLLVELLQTADFGLLLLLQYNIFTIEIPVNEYIM